MEILAEIQEILTFLTKFPSERNGKRNEFVPFFVPQILAFRSCLVPFEKFCFRSCLVPRKKERVHERVSFGTRSSNALDLANSISKVHFSEL